MAAGEPPGEYVTARTLALLFALLVFPGVVLAGPGDPDCPTIVSQSPFITHTLDYLGLDGCIVGSSRYDPAHPDTGGVYDPDAEAIAALAPELAITSEWMDEKEWEAVLPEDTRALVLGGFGGMDAVVRNVERVSQAAGLEDGAARAERFDREWRAAAEAVPASGERVLLLSSCSGQGYTYGPGTWLFDAFAAAGFDVVADQSGVTHLEFSDERDDLADLINHSRAQVVFAFNADAAEECRAITAERPFRVVSLPTEPFQHPAPVIVQGLERLAQERDRWSVGP
ncbi:ABC transporter substrate-binding protein [Thioalkalivibrio sp. ALJ16]|uniref:ABC transporter substrate-binding protein n=1 Tax=Thioalkalivibrio sp. ALJ16 TaxID=1158762 RepID=UPI00035E7083|nr:ABC transporter substrate-binding protein [Thioalkalivibrio sp. ALJ16]